MSEPLLFDTVTLRHLGTAGRLDILQTRYGHRPQPRWTDAVHDEIDINRGKPDCDRVLAIADWLGPPIAATTTADLRGVAALHVALNEGRRPPIQHLGEAESIYFAEQLNGIFVTDDNDAYDFAVHRLGPGRVLDLIGVLREAVATGDLTTSDAHLLANAVRNSGRFLRRVHPPTLPATYFT